MFSRRSLRSDVKMAGVDPNLWYYGSRLLEPVSAKIGLPIDQVNFIVCQMIALAAGYPYRIWLSPEKTSSAIRHIVQIVLGFSLCYFCFGGQVIHYILTSMLCYVLMLILKPGVMEKVVFGSSMGYLAVMHIYRQVYDYGGYTLDITGPLMIAVQKLSSLAFSIRDGKVHDVSKLSQNMKEKAVKNFPNLMEFLSYMLCFHGMMCGPFCFYKDYIEFIEGSNYRKYQPIESIQANNSTSCAKRPEAPSPKRACVYTFVETAVCAGVTLVILPHFPVMFIKSSGFDELGFVQKMTFIVTSTTLHRFKYYFAWKLGELVNATSGLGFNGYDKHGREKWDLIRNADIITIETCTSLKVLLDNWNITTTQWLRYVVYERLHSTLAVFAFSAFWHGYYPGYYITFIGGAFFIHTGRLVRRRVRQYFQTSQALIWLYDFITFVATRMSLGYLVFPHVLLEFWPAYHAYRGIYFWMHILCLLIAVTLIMLPKSKSRGKPTSEEKKVN